MTAGKLLKAGCRFMGNVQGVEGSGCRAGEAKRSGEHRSPGHMAKYPGHMVKYNERVTRKKKASDFSEVSYSNEPEVPVFDENEALRVRIFTKW